MKKLYFVLMAGFWLNSSFAQIPNRGFENWTSREIVNVSNWNTFGSITRINGGIDGSYAVRLQRDSLNSSIPGAILYGTNTGNSITGGIPFAGMPDSLMFDAKYDIPSGDTAWILLILKKERLPICSDTFFITGTHTSDFEHRVYKIKYLVSEMSDSIIIAFTSTNPNNNSGNGYVIIDRVYFTNTASILPNYSFEEWTTVADDEPVGWNSTNKFYLNDTILPVTRSDSSYSGNYAVRIQNVNTPMGMGFGYLINGVQGPNNVLPGFAVSVRDTTFNGYYKYYPQNGDTFNIGILMYKAGNIIGTGFLSGHQPVDTYTKFAIKINYYVGPSIFPDSAAIILLAFNGGSTAYGNSVLYVDELSFEKGTVPDTAGIISGTTEVCKGQNGILYSVPKIKGAGLYIWTLPDDSVIISRSNAIVVNYGLDATSGNISVKGHNDNGDGIERSLAITVTENCSSVIRNLTLTENIHIGPNPLSDKITVSLDKPFKNDYKIDVINSCGSIMTSALKNRTVSKFDLDLAKYPSGIYILRVVTDNNIYQYKLIKL